RNLQNARCAAVDTFGVVGTIFFLVWNLRILARTFRVSFQGNDASGMTLRFLGLYLIVWIGSYWWGALHVGMFLPLEFALTAVFLRLQHMVALRSGIDRSVEEKRGHHAAPLKVAPA